MAQEDVGHDKSANVPLYPPQPRPPSSTPTPTPKEASPPAVPEADSAPSSAISSATPVTKSIIAAAATESEELPPPASSPSISISTTASAPAPAPSISPAASPSAIAALVAAPSIGDSTAAASHSPATVTSPAAVTAASPTTVIAPGLKEAPQNGDTKGHEPDSDSSEMASQHHHGQHMGYPTQSSPYHPAASMSTQYASYHTATSQPGDAYRASPVVTSSMSLPSMRTIDSMPQQQAMGHHGMPMNMGMASVQGGIPFYQHPGAISPGYGMPDAMARYPLPHDPRLMGHRGPKKEIKRRTKTGCLTCRKRRIKCDETHPTCNNCKKSKRECLGYDPIFRQQAGNQSSSNLQSTSSNQSNASAPISIPSSVPSSIPCLPSSGHSNSGVGVRTSNSYGNQPSMLPSAYATSPTPSPATTSSLNYDSTVSAVTPTSVKSEPGYEYSSAIDPALQTLPSTTHMSIHQDSSRFKTFLDNSLHLRAKKMKIDEIIDLLGSAPPSQQISHNEETFNEITKVYHEMYASGLSAFFETSWYYFVENSKMTFPHDAKLIELMASFLKVLEGVKANDHAQIASSGILETRIVWELARTTYQSPEQINDMGQLPPDGDAIEARNRVRVVETLLCGDCLEMNPLAPPAHDSDPHRVRQFEFWYSLGEFVRQHESPQAAAQAREEVLARMRLLLDGRENRDVLYSIAVVRDLAPRFDQAYGSTLPQHLDESEPKNRLAVASKFILDESQVTGGTTNVVRRFSDIASRAFVNPGVNIARLA